MLKHIPDIINFVKKMKSDRLSAYAAQSSLFIFLSFMPFLMLLMTLIRNSALSEEALLEFASTFASPISLTTIKALIDIGFTGPFTFEAVFVTMPHLVECDKTVGRIGGSIEIKRAYENALFETGKYMLESFGAYEE